MKSEKLSQDINNEGGEGYEDTGAGHDERGGLADGGVLGLHLVGLHIDDVVLLEIVVGRADDVGIVEVDGVDFLLALGILTDEFYFFTDTVDGEVTGLSKRLEDVDLLVADGEHTRAIDLAEDGDRVVGHTDRDHGILCGVQVGLDLVVDQLLTHGLGETSDLDGAEDRKLDTALVVNQISLEGATVAQTLTGVRSQGCRYYQVKRCCCLGIDRVDCNGQNVLGHDAGIVEVFGTGEVDVVAVLEISDVLDGSARGEEH